MKFKGLKYFLIVFMMFSINAINVHAENNKIVDFTKKGKVSITLTESTTNTNVEGIEITLYKVADAVLKDNNNLSFQYVEGLEECKGNLNDLSDDSLINNINTCISENETQGISKVSNEEGFVSFTNIDLGLYLVKQTNNKDGYSVMDSYLVALPIVQDNEWVYEVTAAPKMDLVRLMDIVVKKVWNNSYSQIADSITVELLNDDEVVDTIILSEENNWTYTFSELEYSDSYSVKEIDVPNGYVPTYQQNENIYTITNTDTLAQTGFVVWKIQVLAIIGIVLIIMGLGVSKIKRYEKNK